MIFLLFIVFLLLVFLGQPIAWALGLSTLVYILMNDQWSFLVSMPQRMVVAVDNFSLLAVPFFVLVGELMNSGGITARIINFFRTLLGHIRGGIAYVNILTSGFLSAIIGSANAVAAITSKAIVPEMRKDGYTNEYSSAVSAASSILGPLIPPSMVMIIYGITASTSIGALFFAGIVPGVLLMIIFSVISWYLSRKMNVVARQRSSGKEIWQSFVSTIPSLFIPVFVIGGIATGFFTATEAGAIGCLLAFILGKFIYREFKMKELPEMLIRTGSTTAVILIIASTANLFGWVLAMERIPQIIAESLLSLTSDPYLLLLIINIFLLIVGFFLEPFSAILILVPVLLPIVTQLGIDPVHFGVIVSFNLIIGLITPPVGLALFVTSGITKVPVHTLSKTLIPFIVGSVIILFLITYFPPLVMTLPNLLK